MTPRVTPRRWQACAWLLVVFTATALPGCTDFGNREGPGRRSQYLALTPQEELELGRQAYSELLSKYRDRIVREGPQVDQVRNVAKKIVAAAMVRPLQREINLHFNPRFFEWEYTVFRSDQINAFCM